MKILECSSVGDKRYSAFFARTFAFTKEDSIENHYQLSKRFNNEVPPSHWKQVKGRKPTHFHIMGNDYDIKLITQFYKLLWLKYLDEHPELVNYAKQFDDYNDVFGNNASISQADVIRQYVKYGRQSILDDTREFQQAVFNNKETRK